MCQAIGTASSCAAPVNSSSQHRRALFADPTSEDYAAQPCLSTQAATTDCVQRDEAGSYDQRVEHAAPQTDGQEEVTETTNVFLLFSIRGVMSCISGQRYSRTPNACRGLDPIWRLDITTIVVALTSYFVL